MRFHNLLVKTAFMIFAAAPFVGCAGLGGGGGGGGGCPTGGCPSSGASYTPPGVPSKPDPRNTTDVLPNNVNNIALTDTMNDGLFLSDSSTTGRLPYEVHPSNKNQSNPDAGKLYGIY